MSIRLPNSDYLTPDDLDEIYEMHHSNNDDEPVPNDDGSTSDDREPSPALPDSGISDIVRKTFLGRNSEAKRIVELSINDIADMTGISTEEMFGTELTGEKIAYIGAPWQAKKIMDSKRLFVFDYEYGEIADFIKTYSSLRIKLSSILYGEYSMGLLDYFQQLEYLDKNQLEELSISDFESTWWVECKLLVNKIYRIVGDLEKMEKNREPLSEKEIQLEEELINLENLISEREHFEAESSRNRKEIRDAIGDEHAEYHPIEGLHRMLSIFSKKVRSGIMDIEEYDDFVKPHMQEFEEKLPSDLSKEDKEMKLKNEELSILNELRLNKQTENSNIVVGFFPNLPLAEESMDRIVCSYSISTHFIPEADIDDFRSWFKEIQRVLKPGGKAYIFPMQQGFPFGREYDENALYESLDEFSLDNGGHLKYELHKNNRTDYQPWRRDETLIIYKV